MKKVEGGCEQRTGMEVGWDEDLVLETWGCVGRRMVDATCGKSVLGRKAVENPVLG